MHVLYCGESCKTQTRLCTTHSESSFWVADGQVGVVLSVPDLGRAATQLWRPAIFAVVVAHRAVVHHGWNVGEGTLETDGKELSNESQKHSTDDTRYIFLDKDDGQMMTVNKTIK